MIATVGHKSARTRHSLRDSVNAATWAQADKTCHQGAPPEFTQDNYHMGVCLDHYVANKQANTRFPATGLTYLFKPTAYESYKTQVFYDIIRYYAVAAEQGQVPEYITPNQETVIKFIKTQNPSWDVDTIRVVMYYLAQGVHEGYISPQLLQPKTYNAKVVRNENPDIQKYESDKAAREQARADEPDPIKTFLNYLKIGGIVLVVGVGVYALANVTKLVQTVKPATA